MIEIKTAKYNIPFNTHFFSGGEAHFALTDAGIAALRSNENFYQGEIKMRTALQSGNCLLLLMSAVDAIKRITETKIDLYLYYFPGARQDRVCNKGEALSVKIYADIINNLKINKVWIADPHSDVVPALLNNCELYPIENIIRKVIEDCKPDIIISPDAGATKRIEKYLTKIKSELPVVQCLKQRDTKTGKISGFQVIGDFSKGIYAKCLVLDDICDGGATFLGLAKELPAENKYLYITHGIFSKGYDDLLKCYSQIYTTDSFVPKLAPPKEGIKVYNL